jgi:opacity protein-like surface antigen
MTHVTSGIALSSCSSAGRRARQVAAATLVLALGLLVRAKPAAAETTLGVDLSFNDTVDQADTDAGAGVDIYFGPRLDLAIVTLTTELSGGFHDFGGALEPTVYRGLAGGRLGVGLGVRASVFAHVGVGHLRYDDLLGPGRDGRTNLAGDLGAALDFTVLPLIDVGVHASYNLVAGGDEPFEWLQAGAHVIFVLDDA